MSNALTAGRPSARKNPAATLASLTDDGVTKRVNFELAADLHLRLKIYATRQGKTIREVLTEFVEQLPSC
jgi:hypothetical protein